MFEDAEDKVRGALAGANMTALITPATMTAMTANPPDASQLRLFRITIVCLHWESAER